jgi:hypothetical protein
LDAGSPSLNGHLRLISAAKKEFESGTYDYIILMIVAGKKSGEDTKRNPLSGEDRKKFMGSQRELNGVKIIVADTVMNGFSALKEKDIKISAVVGGTKTKENPDENNAESYQQLVKKYFEYEPKAIAVDRDPDGEGTKAVSATMLRHAALEGHWEEFRDNVAYDQETAETAYYRIREANGVKGDG